MGEGGGQWVRRALLAGLVLCGACWAGVLPVHCFGAAWLFIVMGLWKCDRVARTNGLKASGYVANVAMELRNSKLFRSIISRRFGSRYKVVQLPHCCAQDANPCEHRQLPGRVSGVAGLGTRPRLSIGECFTNCLLGESSAVLG